MADDNIFKPADDTNVLLRKILQTLQGSGTVGIGGGDGAAPLQVQQGDLDYTLDNVTVHPNSRGVVVANVALATSLVIKATPGKLLMLAAYNNKGSAQFIQLHNATALPANTAVPILTFSIPTLTTIFVPIPLLCGMDFSTGIVAANSSTAATLTVGSADCWFTAIVI